jgi:hypothetical protein
MDLAVTVPLTGLHHTGHPQPLSHTNNENHFERVHEEGQGSSQEASGVASLRQQQLLPQATLL